MSVTEAKGKFEMARKEAEHCKHSISELQKKSDILEESLPSLTQQIENAERMKQTALDSYALHGDKQSESELRKARTACEQAVKQQSEGNELAEATNRALTKQQAELIRVNNACELAKRECWQAIAEEIKNNIPAHIFEAVKTLLVAGVQCSMTRQFLLDTLFPNLSSGEHQEITSELCEKYNIE